MKRSYFYYLTHPTIGYSALMNKISDRYAIEQQWAKCMDYPLNLHKPQTFNEKLQWLKLHDKRKFYSTMVDKYRVKKWVAEKIGSEHIIPTLATYQCADDIDFMALSNQFVLKCNHDSGSVIICEDRSTLNQTEAQKQLQARLSVDYSRWGREYPYKHVKRCIIAEPYLPLHYDYKFFCFNGKVKCFKIDFDRWGTHGANYYDRHGNLLPFGEVCYPPKNVHLNIPTQLNEMINYAETLALDIPFVRIDFYLLDDVVLFGECTFFPNAGFGRFTTYESDRILGTWLDISDKKSVGWKYKHNIVKLNGVESETRCIK